MLMYPKFDWIEFGGCLIKISNVIHFRLCFAPAGSYLAIECYYRAYGDKNYITLEDFSHEKQREIRWSQIKNILDVYDINSFKEPE